jgi:Ca2+-binding RTX toxin-like protein
MAGDDGSNAITAKEGNDVINGKGGQDSVHGDEGNDVISGGDGDDLLQGGTGADRMSGGDGNDKIAHVVTDNDTFDGKRDVIDCGAGNDEVWINTSHDHDVAVNCEIVQIG